jgi:hypothetical protein
MLAFHYRAVGNEGWQYNCHPNEVNPIDALRHE